MRSKRRSALLYWVFKWVVFAPLVPAAVPALDRAEENIPESGPAILVSNHISAGDTFLVPAMIRRRLTFPAKVELFHGRGHSRPGTGLVPQEHRPGADGPLRRPGQRHQHGWGARRTSRRRSARHLPRGHPIPDGRLYKGKTGVARLVLQAGVPVIPVGMIDTQFVPSRFFKIPTDAATG